MIVDEPTAGLDPAERVRFLNLLSEIGEQAVVILSTHIVEDVADLCPRMAILAGGKILKEGAPSDLMADLRGRIWTKTIDRTDLEAVRAAHEVISTRLSFRSAGAGATRQSPPRISAVSARKSGIRPPEISSCRSARRCRSSIRRGPKVRCRSAMNASAPGVNTRSEPGVGAPITWTESSAVSGMVNLSVQFGMWCNPFPDPPRCAFVCCCAA